jgi:nitrogenase molybdenum-iron protein beta chain
VYVIDDPGDARMKEVTDVAASRVKELNELLFFETDGGLIQRDIKKKVGKSGKALFVGSSWEKTLSQTSHGFYTFLSLPLPETVVVNQSYVGYSGGLNLLEEIYSNVFKSKTTTSRTQFILDEAG